MLSDIERDKLRVQAKNMAIKLRREFEANKLEGREDAQIQQQTNRVEGGGAESGGSQSIGGASGATAQSPGDATVLPTAGGGSPQSG